MECGALVREEPSYLSWFLGQPEIVSEGLTLFNLIKSKLEHYNEKDRQRGLTLVMIQVQFSFDLPNLAWTLSIFPNFTIIIELIFVFNFL